MITLTSKERKLLEKKAHAIEPIVIIGQNGVTPTVIMQVKNALKTHELLKVKFNEFKDERFELADQIAAETDSVKVRLIGNILILFKEKEEEE